MALTTPRELRPSGQVVREREEQKAEEARESLARAEGEARAAAEARDMLEERLRALQERRKRDKEQVAPATETQHTTDHRETVQRLQPAMPTGSARFLKRGMVLPME